MQYITVKEASEKWGISTRRVCVLCSNGKIPGAVKKSKVWMIPAGAGKPEDGRKVEFTNELEPIVLLYQPTYFDTKPGHQPTKEEAGICEIQEKFLRGNLKEAYAELDCMIHKCEEKRYLVMLHILKGIIAADLGVKDIFTAFMNKAYCPDTLGDECQFETAIARIFFGVDRTEDCMLFLRNDVYADLMPLVGMLIAKRRINEMVQNGISSERMNLEVICKELDTKDAPVICAYYHIFLAVFYNALCKADEYEYHIQKAIRILLPRGWYTPLAEYAYTLDLSFLKKKDAEAYRMVTELSEKIVQNYVESGVFDAIYAKPRMATKLNIQIGFKIIQGKSNEEIAEELGISQYKVKRHIEDLCLVGGLSSKKEIRQFILKSFFV